MQYYSSKTVADILNVSPSTIRLYAKKMENLGHIFRKVNDAREFSNDEVNMFKTAQEYYERTGGTIYRALYFAKMKRQYGEEVAHDEIDKSYAQSLEAVTTNKDLTKFKKELLTEMEVCVKDKVQQSFDDFVKQMKDTVDDTSYNPDIEKIMQEKEELIEKDIEHREKIAALENRLANIKSLSIRDFKNWKKHTKL